MRSCELSIAALRRAYRNGSKTPRRVLTELLDACAAAPDGIWISLIDREQLEVRLAGLEASSPEELPLYGIPFAVKDNIDVAGLPTTAGCPDCSYRPERSARVVELLIEAGAVPLGKTNMDALSQSSSPPVLVGVRSPYGAAPNRLAPDMFRRIEQRIGRGAGVRSVQFFSGNRYGGLRPGSGGVQ